MAEKWISSAIKRPGALHRALHVPEGEKIPAKKMAKAKRSENPRVRRMAGLARTLKSFHHASGGQVCGEGEAPKHRGDRARRKR
jgi:hypothetical protein